jgi:histone-lysine N-methyltransferase SETD1
MSRASGASFAQFFPSAPRAAKDKAKEREKSKSQSLELPLTRPVADGQIVSVASQPENATTTASTEISTHTAADSIPPLEDNESVQGDLLNGIGSASSHTSSTVSSVLSAPAQSTNMSTFGGSRNVSSLTPLTNIDSSPSHVSSPNQYKRGVQTSNASEPNITGEITHNDISPIHAPVAEVASTRVFARDPNTSVKGEICTYDPLLDRKMNSSDKKKAKPIYKEFGLVRIYNLLGGRHLVCKDFG